MEIDGKKILLTFDQSDAFNWKHQPLQRKEFVIPESKNEDPTEITLRGNIGLATGRDVVVTANSQVALFELSRTHDLSSGGLLNRRRMVGFLIKGEVEETSFEDKDLLWVGRVKVTAKFE